jgi:hypothetical protein
MDLGFRGVRLTPADRACLEILMPPASAKGWHCDILPGLYGLAEAIRLFPPRATAPAFLLVRLDGATVGVMTGRPGTAWAPEVEAVGRYGGLADALVSLSRALDREAPLENQTGLAADLMPGRAAHRPEEGRRASKTTRRPKSATEAVNEYPSGL